MKKLLLLFALTLVSIGSQAGPDDFSWTSGSFSLSLTETEAQPGQQVAPEETLNVSTPGSLAAWVAYLKSDDYKNNVNGDYNAEKPFMGLGQHPEENAQGLRKLKITGQLNAADLAALSSLECAGFSRYPIIDMTGVSLAGGATADDVLGNINFQSKSYEKAKPGPDGGTETVTGNGAQYIALPYGVTDVADMESLKENGKNNNLKVAGTYAGTQTEGVSHVDKSEFAAYSFVKGNMSTFLYSCFSEIPGNPHEDNIMKLTLGGQIAVNDISQGNGGSERLFRSSNLNDMDLYECTFEDCQITLGSSMGQGYINPTPIGETIDTNALYYLKNYALMSCILPKGNDEIPPQTFANNTFNASTVHIGNIVIPEGYKKIGFEAFYGHSLQTLDLPSTLEVVEAGAFRHNPGMSQLTDVTMQPLQGECTFGEAAFAENQMLKHVTLSEGVTNIADQMFNQCLLLESIRIPSTCKTIGRRAFYECYDLHVITIPEGVEAIYQEAFELTGLTDIYVMATSPATVPKIYAMDPNGNGPSTFTYQRTTGNNTVPAAHRDDLPWTNDGYDEVVSWYQAEMSGSKGLGTGNALVALHYPDEMKGFYEGINVSEFFTEEELADVCGWADSEIWTRYVTFPGVTQNDINQKISGTDAQGKPFQYLPQAYSIDPHDDGSNPLMGPDKDGKYYPNQMDYVMRMAAGATGTQAGGSAGQCMSAWGWRQFPLAAAIGDIGKVPFDKLYDDTWYTMCFPWHMTDNELFSAFNQNMEITEFVGVEMIEQGDPETNAANKDWTYELVLHFDDVAITTYRDLEDVEYEREKIGHRIINGEDRNVYKYTSKVDDTVVSYPLSYIDLNGTTQNSAWQEPPGKNDNSAEAEAVREAYGKYLSIRNILSLAGHPYMIHPSIGAQPGNPATVYINSELKMGGNWTTTKQAVTKVATIDDQALGEVNPGATEQPNKGGQTEFKNPITNGGGSYTFIGNVGKEAETDQVDADGNKVMPTPAYFLAVPFLYSEEITEPIYEEVEVPVLVNGKQVYKYTYVGEGKGNVQRMFVDDHYEYVGEGGQYVPTAFGPKTTSNPAYEVATYDFNSSNFTYVGPNQGNYNPETYVQSTGTGHYNMTTPAHYEHTNQGGGEYKATKFEPVTSGGEYSGNNPYDSYILNVQSLINQNKEEGNFKPTNVTQVSGGSYVHFYSYTNAGDGNWDASQNDADYVPKTNQQLGMFSKENGNWVYKGPYNGTHTPIRFVANPNGTGNFNSTDYYIFVGNGNGEFDVEFTGGDQSWNQPGCAYIKQASDLQYTSNNDGNWHVTEYTYVGQGQGDWNFVPATYEYVADGNADWEAQSFTQVGDYQGSYTKNDASQADWIYNANGTGAFEATAWRAVGEGETGTYDFVPMSIQYVDVAQGEGSYTKTPKTTIEKRETGQTQTVIVNHYDKYPKYYRKMQTSGNKWSKYSAIIRPDENAVANIENYLNYQQASANGFDVAFGEWEEVSTTAIEEIVAEAERNNEPVQKIHLNVVYNIKGQVVRNDGSTSLEGLPKGLYIVNGKKYMVK